ncbi:putative periplasmic lipoprotein [Helicobacter felis]|uniref:Flagellar motor switch protein n=1 Tax=Helicobacter felis (strain ATCC 49179 / CCUG 28539 / NCTC 12436 / CS1) TaxID=936155 RepID=E7ACT6_HELFC|nr:hypothetical protein [Helicobacter felis]CBY82266.1 putative flagellar motor switch protein [Helicobacter felis ATCC 49179]
MKSLFVLLPLAFLLAGCGRSSETGDYIRGCQRSGLDYKTCSCLAEKIIGDATEEEFKNEALLRKRAANPDPKILRKCIGKQDAKEMISRALINQNVPKSTAVCLAKKFLKQLSDEEIELLETPSFGPVENQKVEAVQHKILQLAQSGEIESCK